MATATAEHPAEHDEHADDHPSDGQYVKIALALGFVTALEVGTYFITDDPYSHSAKWFLIFGLLIMMAIKFGVVVAYFMHLKFDNPIFRRMFFTGLVLALIVYGIVFAAFRYFSDEYENVTNEDLAEPFEEP